jgi:hypothetical protein
MKERGELEIGPSGERNRREEVDEDELKGVSRFQRQQTGG